MVVVVVVVVMVVEVLVAALVVQGGGVPRVSQLGYGGKGGSLCTCGLLT